MYRRSGILLAAAVLVTVLGAAMAVSAQSASSSELPDGAIKAKAQTACTECHEARIVVQQRLSKAAWTKEVDKMVKWGAVVDASDRNALIDYLSSNFGVDKPPYEADRSQSSTGKK